MVMKIGTTWFERVYGISLEDALIEEGLSYTPHQTPEIKVIKPIIFKAKNPSQKQRAKYTPH